MKIDFQVVLCERYNIVSTENTELYTGKEKQVTTVAENEKSHAHEVSLKRAIEQVIISYSFYDQHTDCHSKKMKDFPSPLSFSYSRSSCLVGYSASGFALLASYWSYANVS